MGGRQNLLLLLLSASALAGGGGAATASPAGVVIGRSPTGAVCVAQPSSTAEPSWRIQCDGDRQPQGAVWDGSDADLQAQQKATDNLALCQPAENIVLPGLENARRTVCAAGRDGRRWMLFEAEAPGAPQRRLSLEIPAALADLAGAALRAPLQPATGLAPPSPGEARWKAAYSISQTGDFAAAEQRFSEITLAASGADGQRAEAYLNWALESSNLGRPAAAAEHFRQADALISALKDQDLEALSSLYKAVAARNESRFEDAVRWARAAIHDRDGARPRDPSSPRAEAGEARIDVDTAMMLNADAPEAEEPCAANAVGACAQSLRDLRSAYAAYLAGTALEALGDATAAVRALDDAAARMTGARTLDRLADEGAGWLAADIQAERARLALDRGDIAAALADARAARSAVRAAPVLAGSAQDAATRLLLARVEAAHGDAAASDKDYDLAFETLRTGPGGLSVDPEDAEAYFDGQLRRLGNSADANSAATDRLLSAMQSLQFDETGAEVLRLRRRLERDPGPDAALAQTAASARQALAAARLKVDGDLDVDAAEEALHIAQTRLSDAEQDLFARHPELARSSFSVATASELRAALAKGELYVKILLFANRGYGLAIDAGRTRVYRIPMGRTEVAQRVETLRRPFDDPIRLTRFDVEAAHRLYVALFGPVAEAAAQATHVIFDADASLQSLPPALLVTDEASVSRYQTALRTAKETGRHDLDLYADVQWLGRRAQVSSSLSPQGFLDLRRRPPSAARKVYVGYGGARPESPEDPNLFAAIAASDPYAPDCAQTRRSTAELAAQAPPRPAATTALRDIAYGVSSDTGEDQAPLSDFRVILIGARGLNPTANGCLGAPALATSLGDAQADGLLTADRIAGLKLDAELVVLTGWSTGGGAGSGGVDSLSEPGLDGQALAGLADAFVAAGARNMLLSHWEAPTRATVQLITDTLSARDAEAAGLRRAQIRLMDAPATSHPYYWAGFALVGDGARSLAPPSH